MLSFLKVSSLWQPASSIPFDKGQQALLDKLRDKAAEAINDSDLETELTNSVVQLKQLFLIHDTLLCAYQKEFSTRVKLQLFAKLDEIWRVIQLFTKKLAEIIQMLRKKGQLKEFSNFIDNKITCSDEMLAWEYDLLVACLYLLYQGEQGRALIDTLQQFPHLKINFESYAPNGPQTKQSDTDTNTITITIPNDFFTQQIFVYGKDTLFASTFPVIIVVHELLHVLDMANHQEPQLPCRYARDSSALFQYRNFLGIFDARELRAIEGLEGYFSSENAFRRDYALQPRQGHAIFHPPKEPSDIPVIEKPDRHTTSIVGRQRSFSSP